MHLKLNIKLEEVSLVLVSSSLFYSLTKTKYNIIKAGKKTIETNSILKLQQEFQTIFLYLENWACTLFIISYLQLLLWLSHCCFNHSFTVCGKTSHHNPHMYNGRVKIISIYFNILKPSLLCQIWHVCSKSA